MTSYTESKDHVELIGKKVAAREMPPWMPAPECGSFVDDRRLSDAEMKTLVDWVATGAVEGNPADAPPGGDAVAQHLESADVTLMPPTVYTPVGDPNDPKKLDDYHCQIVDPALAADRDVIGFEVIPGVPREVHHVILYTASAAAAQQADAATPEQGWTCFGGPGTSGSSLGALGGWVPGMPPTHYPATTGIRLKQGDVIVMQVHYNLLNGPPLPDRTTVKLDYSDAPVEKLAQIYPAADLGFVIPPHSEGYSTTVSQAIPLTAQVWGITPHMHTLGQRITVKTDSQCLIDIPKWDFHWQQSYFYDAPQGLTVHKGEKATLTCTWSNPRDTAVRWGESTSDEMCLAFFYTTL